MLWLFLSERTPVNGCSFLSDTMQIFFRTFGLLACIFASLPGTILFRSVRITPLSGMHQ